ncbi:MAG: LysR family transcriptional regulator [Firmicutes bacterium]|nr:LysR family transcriptional regulator [Bacillota bacterium]
MNERKLRIFYEVATNLSMTETAEKLYISQPAISQTIKELENNLNIILFDRINKKLFLTYEGKVFLNYTRRILNLYDESLDKIKDINTLNKGKLKIGASTTIGIYILTDIIGKFTKKHKNIDTSITIENTKIIADMILENKIDFAFVEGPVHSSEIIVKEFLNDELVFITSPEHPWVKKKNVDIKEVENQKLIMREEGSGTREIVKRALKKNEVNYNIYLELGNIEAIKRAVKADLGISCISKRCVREEVKNNSLCIIPLKNTKIKRKLNIIHHNDKYLTKLFYHFMNFAKEESKEI